MADLERQVADLTRQVRQLQAQLHGQAGPGVGVVSSFNSRAGYVVLTLEDITDLLTYVASFQGRTGAVTLTKADVTGTGLAAADVAAVATSQIGAASGVAGLDASSRLAIPAGVGAPSTGTGAIGIGTLVGWIPIVISGVQSKIPIFQ